MTNTTVGDESSVPDVSPDDRVGECLSAARRCLNDASDRTTEDRDRVIELLSVDLPSESVEQELERRVAASGALRAIAHDNPGRLADRLPVLTDELRLELERTITSRQPELRDRSRAIRGCLVSSIAHPIADDPTVVSTFDGFGVFAGAVTADLTDETLRVATNSLCVCASEHAESVGQATESLGELLAHSDEAVQAWSAGTLGQVAREAPDAVATTAGGLRSLLDHENEAVQHNAVEALGALVRERPDAVAPAADTLRGLLAHDGVAIRHNATKLLGCLATTHPDAVMPAVEDLRERCTRQDEPARQVAAGALARLARERTEAVTDG